MISNTIAAMIPALPWGTVPDMKRIRLTTGTDGIAAALMMITDWGDLMKNERTLKTVKIILLLVQLVCDIGALVILSKLDDDLLEE